MTEQYFTEQEKTQIEMINEQYKMQQRIMTEEKLKLCSHCGSDDIRVESIPYFTVAKRIACWGCGLSTKVEPNLKKAIEKWNRRS